MTTTRSNDHYLAKGFVKKALSRLERVLETQVLDDSNLMAEVRKINDLRREAQERERDTIRQVLERMGLR